MRIYFAMQREIGVPLELHEALEQIDEIRGRLAGAETFRGYRAASVAATGLVAVITGLVQPAVVPNPAADPIRYVLLWVTSAVLCALGAGTEILYGYWQCASAHRRATTRIVVGQLVPSITAGALLTWALMSRDTSAAPLLPGLWATLVGLGVFASRRHLPRTIGWVGLYYLAAGAAILAFRPGPASLAPWVMAGAFGIGQAAAAIVLYWNLERNEA